MSFKEISIESPIEEKIAWAKNCFQDKKKVLYGDTETDELLKKFKKAAEISHKEMARAGIEYECRRCEERDGGSCCGVGLENKYSGVLILINLLLGLKMPQQRLDTKSCFFLKETGCSLKARHVICVDYLCKKITERIDPERIATMREKEGFELECLFLLNERVKTVIKEI
jgi:hypothetical protein